MTHAEQIAALKAEVAALKASPKRAVKVQTNLETGTVQIRGLRHPWPIAFYPGEWDVILSDKVVADVRAQLDAARPIADAHKLAKANG